MTLHVSRTSFSLNRPACHFFLFINAIPVTPVKSGWYVHGIPFRKRNFTLESARLTGCWIPRIVLSTCLSLLYDWMVNFILPISLWSKIWLWLDYLHLVHLAGIPESLGILKSEHQIYPSYGLQCPTRTEGTCFQRLPLACFQRLIIVLVRCTPSDFFLHIFDFF
jgi:hypothetical protein